jgi:hypothetical protein
MTDGLSACNIVVTDNADCYNFYHDADGKALQQFGSALIGREVAKVCPADYDPGNQLNGIMAQYTKNEEFKQKPIQGGHFIIAVKRNGRFGLYVSGFMTAGGRTSVVSRSGSSCVVTLP